MQRLIRHGIPFKQADVNIATARTEGTNFTHTVIAMCLGDLGK